MASTVAAKRILIADPSDKNRQALASFLREKGMEVIEAVDGSRALAETLLRKPDILMLDLSVPILGADRLIQILRTNPNTKSVPIFFLSDHEQSISGFRQGLDKFLRKPFHEEEVLLRIQRSLFKDPLSEAVIGDSEISGNLSQIFLPDLWQMLSMNRKNGILQVEGEGVSGSVYIEKGEIISAATRNIVGEKALYRLIPLKAGKFRFLPGKPGVRRTIFTPSQHAILEGLRQDDELRKISGQLPLPGDTVEILREAGKVAAPGGAMREVLLLAEFCGTVEEIVDHCGFPDLVVYEALQTLRDRGILRIGSFERRPFRCDFLPKEELALLRARLEDRLGGGEGGSGQVVFYFPDPTLLEGLVAALGRFADFAVDPVFFAFRRKEGVPLGMFGKMLVGEKCSLRLYAFPYLSDVSPLWYVLAPAPIGVVVFLQNELSGSLENLMPISDFIRGAGVRVVLVVMRKPFEDFGIGENTLRLFRSRIERMGCTVKIQAMDEMTPEEIRDSLAAVVRQYLEVEST